MPTAYVPSSDGSRGLASETDEFNIQISPFPIDALCLQGPTRKQIVANVCTCLLCFYKYPPVLPE